MRKHLLFLALHPKICYNVDKIKAVRIVAYIFVILGGYLLGSSSMAFYLSKWKAVDIRTKGSGNLGASNTTTLLGWWAGILVALHDIGKAVLAVILAKLVFPQVENVGAVAGVACVLGHIFPFYLKFKGGKGFASFWGMTLALNWKLALVLAVISVIITVVTDYISLATTATAVAVPTWLGISTHSLLLPLIIFVATAVILYKHKENYRRILKGEELGLRGAIKGENRIK